MKKSVLIIGNYPPPYGGVPHHIERLTKFLIEKGWACHVISAGTIGSEEKGLLHVYRPSYLRKIIGFFRQIGNYQFDRWREKGDLNREQSDFWMRYKIYADVGTEIIRNHDIQIIVAYNLLTYGPVGAYLSKQFKLPLVINIFGEAYKFDAMRNNIPFFQHVLSEADLLLSCSTHCGGSIRLLGSDRHVETVTYGVDTIHFSPGEAKELRRRLAVDNAPIIMFIGRLSREMGLDIFINLADALSTKFPSARFYMVGQAGDLSELALEKAAGSNGRYLVHQNMSYHDLADFYRIATVVVVPTRGERTCSSLAAMEAMSTGKPVVAFSVGGIPEIIAHGRTGLLVQPENTQELINAVDRLMSDCDLQANLAKAGFREAQDFFYENRVFEVMEEKYLSILNKQ